MMVGIHIASAINVITKIEKALRIKLYPKQIEYLLGTIKEPNYDIIRRTGKTTAFCIKLALSDGIPLNLKKPESFSDAVYCVGPDHKQRYSKDFFVPEFMKIRERLSECGFKVRDVYYPKRTTGGFIIGD